MQLQNRDVGSHVHGLVVAYSTMTMWGWLR